MRILAFDHFFDQDLDALRAGLGPGEDLHVLPYRRLHKRARAHFPAAAFDTLDAPFAAGMDARWRSYLPVARRFASWLAAAYRPSVFVVPNDNFFYLRPVIERLRSLGVPAVVVQKETTIAPLTMDVDSEVIRRYVPFMCDVMTVCSDRHREFAVRCGAAPQQVVVTGQPRFDLYAQARARRAGPVSSRPTVLYLSYDDLSYLPGDGSLGSWHQLRVETERVLGELAAAGVIDVVAKLHPQQQATDDDLGPAAHRARRGADTRALIAQADVVVGFQTTALFEAAVAGRPIVYPAWGPVYEAAEDLLIPFAESRELVHHATAADQLRAMLTDTSVLTAPGPAGRAEAEAHLGPVDGGATARVLEVVRRFAGPGPAPATVSVTSLARAAAKTVAGPVATAGAAVLRRTGRSDLADGADRQAGYWVQEGREAWRIVRKGRDAQTR